MIKHKYLILRRLIQSTILLLYFGANAWGWSVLMGNLSSSKLFGTIPLSDPYAALQMFVAGATLTIDVVVGALIVTIFYGVIGGRVFCSWVCPMNMVTDLANYIRREMGFNEIQKRQPATRSMRYWIILLSLVISFIFGVGAFELISPISMLHRGIVFGIGFGFAAVVVIFLFDQFVLKNGWCGHLCPLGGFYSIVGKLSLVRVKYDESKCSSCMKCKEVCPESHVLSMVTKSSGEVLHGECSNCARCVEVCNDDALNFSIRDLKKKKSKE